MSSQTTLQTSQAKKRERPERTVRIVLYGELPEGVINWLSRKFEVQELPELEDTAKRMAALKKKLRELETEKEAQEYMKMLEG